MLAPIHIKTLVAMLRFRGYEVDETKLTNYDANTPVTFQHHCPDNSLQHNITVFLLPVSKLGIAVLRKHVALIQNSDITHAIIIVQDGITPQALQTKKTLLQEQHIFIEMFTLSDLAFDIMAHAKVPPHRVLRQVEILQRKLSADKHKKMLTTDAVARYLGLLSGDAVEITRYTPTGTVKVYRVVVSA